MLSIKPDLYLISTILLYNQHNTFPDFACELRSPSCTSSCSVLCAQVSWHVLDLKVFFPLSATSSCFLRAAFQKSHRHSLTAGIYLGAVWKNQSWQKGWVCQGPANREGDRVGGYTHATAQVIALTVSLWTRVVCPKCWKTEFPQVMLLCSL